MGQTSFAIVNSSVTYMFGSATLTLSYGRILASAHCVWPSRSKLKLHSASTSLYQTRSLACWQQSDPLRRCPKSPTTHSTLYWDFWPGTKLSRAKRSRARETSSDCARGALSADSQHGLDRMCRSICEALGLRRLSQHLTLRLHRSDDQGDKIAAILRKIDRNAFAPVCHP